MGLHCDRCRSFQGYNDSFGHVAGDQALVNSHCFFSRQIRAEEGQVRMGGDDS